MIPSNLVFLSACPHDSYFIWQCEVFITNFKEKGIPENQIHVIVWYPKEGLNKDWDKIKRKYSRVKFFFYEDQGVDLELYIPQLRPHILKRYFNDHKEILEGKQFFYHDADIIFNFLPNFYSLIEGDLCWQSDTSHYLDYDYLRRKEQQGNIPEDEAVAVLADIGRVSVETIKSYQGKTGGAQYLLKGISSDFWEDVERQVLEIRKAFFFNIPGSVNRKYFKTESEGFQSWCADMWAVNFSLWSRGKETNVTPELDFSWATDSYQTFLKKPIFHNAGATPSNKKLFYKGAWVDRSPIVNCERIRISKLFASHAYVEAIKKVK